MRTKILVLFTLIASNLAIGQSTWKKINLKNFPKKISNKNLIIRDELPKKLNLFLLATEEFKQRLNLKSRGLANTIKLPDPDGNLETFEVQETFYLEKELSKKFPNIKSYSAKSTTRKNTTAKISIGSDGIHVVIHSPEHSTLYIDPHTKDKKIYRSYLKKDHNTKHFNCKPVLRHPNKKSFKTGQRTSETNITRTYRLAMACTTEYAIFHLKQQNIPSSASIKKKKEAVLSAINTTITRVNQIYERELSIRLILVAKNDLLLNIDENVDDELENDYGITLLGQSQTICDELIGDENYDIGHTVSTGVGGLAAIGALCLSGVKAKGVTGSEKPINDAFDVDFVTHEIGHQFGADHTFGANTGGNCNGNRVPKTAVEPGSGSTIMGYAGICGNSDIQKSTDDYFHSVSIAEISSYVTDSVSCSKNIITTDKKPIVNAGNDYAVPCNTPLKLKGASTNKIDNNLSYCWEQIDNEFNGSLPLNTHIGGPSFRSYHPTKSPIRYLPKIETILEGKVTNKWEKIPSVARTLNFSLTLRKRYNNFGTTVRDDLKIEVIKTEPFQVSSQNSETTWATGDVELVTWDISTTNKKPINCQKVNIRLSIDGGLTYPIFLAKETNNDGNQKIIVPKKTTTKARIMVEAADNIFFDINNTNISITEEESSFLFKKPKNELNNCSDENKVNYVVDVIFKNNFKKIIRFETSDLPNGITAKISPRALNSNGKLNISLTIPPKAPQGAFVINIKGVSKSITKATSSILNIIRKQNTNLNLISPDNQSKNLGFKPALQWEVNKSLSKYTIEIATDKDFNNIAEKNTVPTNTYTSSKTLTKNTLHYWRVYGTNLCQTFIKSSIFSFTTQDIDNYCESTFTDPNAVHITNVTINTINNKSGNQSNKGYEDYKSQVTSILKEKLYLLTVNIQNNGEPETTIAYIDWNQDYKFDSNETYTLKHSTNPLIKKAFIKIPKDAKTGKTRLRIVCSKQEKGMLTGACSNNRFNSNTNKFNQNGETEDYTIEVLNTEDTKTNFFSDVKIFPNPTKDNTLTIKSTAKQGEFFIDLHDIRGVLMERLITDYREPNVLKKIRFKPVNEGVYIITLRDEYNRISKKIIFLR